MKNDLDREEPEFITASSLNFDTMEAVPSRRKKEAARRSSPAVVLPLWAGGAAIR